MTGCPRLHTRAEWDPATIDAAHDLIDAVTLATVVTSSPDGMAASHLPVMLDRTRGAQGVLVSHLASANDHAALIAEGHPTLAIIMGPQAYISSSWYPGRPEDAGRRNNAPTWNFAVLHVRGRPKPLDHAATARHIIDLVAHLDRDRPDPWSVAELGPGGMARRMPAILGFEMPIDSLESKFKMGQDEPLADTLAAAAHLAGGENAEVASWMIRLNADRRR
jgi:transcriptional regulator